MFRGRGGALFGSNQVSIIKIECCKNIRIFKCFYNTPFIMRVAGLEPARYRYRGILSPLCLPIPPHPHKLPAGTFQHVPQLKTRTFTCTALMSLSHILGTLVGEGGFEPPKLLAADLQSVPFGHSGIHPFCLSTISIYIINKRKAQGNLSNSPALFPNFYTQNDHAAFI